MSNFNDLAPILEISNTLNISHSSSNTNRDLSQNSLDHFSAIKSNNKCLMSQETNSIEKIIKSLTLCEENVSEHIKTDIIYQCLREVSLNTKEILSEETTNKLKALLLIHELNKYMHFSSFSKHLQEKLTLLGIENLPLSDLSYDEKLEVKCCVETMLREKIHDMILSYEALGGNIKEVLKNNRYNMCNKFLECYEIPVTQWKDRIEALALEYENVLLKYIDLMETWNKLKYEDMSQAYLDKSELLLLQAQVVKMQAKIMKLSYTIKMFTETPTSVDAFKMLNQMVKRKLKAVTDEIRQKQDLKKLYDNLKNTEYDEVLKDYLELCKAIKKKKQILDMLK